MQASLCVYCSFWSSSAKIKWDLSSRREYYCPVSNPNQRQRQRRWNTHSILRNKSANQHGATLFTESALEISQLMTQLQNLMEVPLPKVLTCALSCVVHVCGTSSSWQRLPWLFPWASPTFFSLPLEGSCSSTTLGHRQCYQCSRSVRIRYYSTQKSPWRSSIILLCYQESVYSLVFVPCILHALSFYWHVIVPLT